MEQLQLGKTTVAPGKMEFGALECGSHRDGTLISIPFIVANGSEDGPTLCLSSLIHGDEVPGIEVVRRVMREEITPTRLRGAIIAIPALNPLATRAAQHLTPEEGLDLCAEFPGDLNGALTRRMAHIAYQELISKCDYYIDFHANYSPAVEFSIIPKCENRRAIDGAIEMANAFGWPIQASSLPGSPAEAVLNSGKPAMLPELVGNEFAVESSVRKAVRGTLNVLIHLGMIEGEIQEHDDLAVGKGRFGRAVVRVASGGIVHFTTGVGTRVKEDEVIGVVHDVYGQEVEEVRSPVNGYIRTLIPGPGNQLVHSGQIVATFLVIADADSLWSST